VSSAAVPEESSRRSVQQLKNSVGRALSACVNQGGTGHKCYTWRLVILQLQTY